MTYEGKVCWRSPSNIALIKYWGKYDEQLPQNPSISMTLSNCTTTTEIKYRKKENADPPQIIFLFEDQVKPAFGMRVQEYIQRLAKIDEALLNYDYIIESSNSFPHSAGIASSASAMSALALGLYAMLHPAFNTPAKQPGELQVISEWARLGSGSASRSLSGGYMVWGAEAAIPGSSDMFAIPLQASVAPMFQQMNDVVLVVSDGVKKRSSTAGHRLMINHPYAKARYEQARKNLATLLEAMRTGNFDLFAQLVEYEALNLHGLMMSSQPGYLLLEPNTLAVIDRIINFRQRTGLPVCFTLDAGPNVHVLFPNEAKDEVLTFIRESLVAFCRQGRYIEDAIGDGPTILYHEYV